MQSKQNMTKFNPTQILEQVVGLNASDLHLSAGSMPYVRINTELKPLSEYSVLTVEDVELFLSQILDRDQKDIFDVNKELDFSVALGNKARFRVNAFYQKGYPSAALRLIPMIVPKLESLNLPEAVSHVCNLKQGMVLVVGPTGSGKSTTLAAMIEKINESRAEHILTIEDPVEYVFSNKLSLIEQREMYIDSHSWEVALKSVLRQDPNVVLIGEMRDAETIATALELSETGHLVLASMHTNSAAQTVERMIASFPDSKQNQIRAQFASIIEVIFSQRLLPSVQKGIIPAVEIMLASDAIKNLIRDGKSHMIDNIISTGANLGMTSIERSLANLVNAGLVDIADASRYSMKPDELRRLIKEEKLH